MPLNLNPAKKNYVIDGPMEGKVARRLRMHSQVLQNKQITTIIQEMKLNPSEINSNLSQIQMKLIQKQSTNINLMAKNEN